MQHTLLSEGDGWIRLNPRWYQTLPQASTNNPLSVESTLHHFDHLNAAAFTRGHLDSNVTDNFHPTYTWDAKLDLCETFCVIPV